jgi:hypothetical protein
MRIVRLLSLIASFALASAPLAHAQAPAAAPATSPYSVTVPVPDTTAAVRSQAFASALTQVLARAIGGQDPRTLSGFDAALKQAPGMVQQYQYSRSTAGGMPLNLDITFDQGAVRRILAAAAKTEASGDDKADVAEGPSKANIWVSGIRSAADYASVLAAFGGDPAVRSVDTIAAESDGILLEVNATGPMLRIVTALGAGANLPTAPGSHPGADFNLRWSP